MEVVATIATLLTQLGMAAGAYRLARALEKRVEDHEIRLAKLEQHEERLDEHHDRISRLETF